MLAFYFKALSLSLLRTMPPSKILLLEELLLIVDIILRAYCLSLLLKFDMYHASPFASIYYFITIR